MNGFQTSRVLVLDDDTKDSIELIRAFAKQGVGVVYYSGEERFLPPQPLHGIRLAAIDLDLAGLSGEATAVVGPTLAALKALIARDNGPYLALLWTARPELIDAFTGGASDLPCPGAAVVTFEKSDAKDRDGEFDIRLIEERLVKVVAEQYPLALVNFWEQLVHDAATNTTNTATESGNEWNAAATQMLAALLSASSHDLEDSTVCLRALLEALSPLHVDHLEALVYSCSDEQAELIRPLQERASKQKTSQALKADLNRRLLVGRPVASPSPGDIYLLDKIADCLGSEAPTLDDLKNDMMEESKRDTEPAGDCIPVLVELTPLCDYHFGDVKAARFVAGLAVPADSTKVLKSPGTAFIRKLEPIAFRQEDLDGQYVLAWSAHFVVTTLRDNLVGREPVCRLRQPPLAALQAWAASQAARPGYLSI